MKKRILSLILMLSLLMLPVNALAAKASVKMPVKIGMMYVGQSLTVKPKVSGISRSSLKWQSSAASVLTASGGGKLTAKKEGLALVRASAGGAQAICGVVVLPRSISLKVGETYRLPSHSVLDYASADAKIASIGSSGVVRGVKAGSTRVGVKYGKVGLSVNVTVSPSAETQTSAPQQSKAAKLDCAGQTDQIVLVEYSGGSKATVSFHEKKNGVWTQLASTTGYVGRNGIGKTREGDGRTPSGTFNLTTPFGIKADPGANMPYTKVTKYHYWCGTSGSEYYNRLVDTRKVNRSAKSTDEKLINYTGYYNYCLFIDYNASGEANKGSCIFLHCTGSKTSTAGCIAIPENIMKTAIQWVRPGAKIVIR